MKKRQSWDLILSPMQCINVFSYLFTATLTCSVDVYLLEGWDVGAG